MFKVSYTILILWFVNRSHINVASDMNLTQL
jgi:hypothetical protein